MGDFYFGRKCYKAPVGCYKAGLVISDKQCCGWQLRSSCDMKEAPKGQQFRDILSCYINNFYLYNCKSFSLNHKLRSSELMWLKRYKNDCLSLSHFFFHYIWFDTCREAFTTLTLTHRYVVNSVIFIIALHPSLVSFTSHTQCV